MKSDKLFDHEKFNFNIARLKKGGEVFEIVVDSDLAVAYKEGKNVEIDDVIQSEKIYSSANHSQLASENIMKNVFHTDNINEIARLILSQGEIHLTAEYKSKIREAKKKQIIYLIHKNSIDPRTNAPHTIDRITTAVESKKIRIDEFSTPLDQVKSVVDEIKTILPLKFENKKYSIRVYSEHAPRAVSFIQKYTTPIDTSWNDDGSVSCIIEVSPGIGTEIIKGLNNMTKGGIEIEIIN